MEQEFVAITQPVIGALEQLSTAVVSLQEYVFTLFQQSPEIILAPDGLLGELLKQTLTPLTVLQELSVQVVPVLVQFSAPKEVEEAIKKKTNDKITFFTTETLIYPINWIVKQ